MHRCKPSPNRHQAAVRWHRTFCQLWCDVVTSTDHIPAIWHLTDNTAQDSSVAGEEPQQQQQHQVSINLLAGSAGTNTFLVGVIFADMKPDKRQVGVQGACSFTS